MNTKTLLTFSALALGLLPMAAPARADEMSGMDRSGAKTAQKPQAALLSVTATLNPAAPQAGDNTLNLTVLDATGKPVTGLKLTTTVAMTSMDMGTTHPAFTETGGGHYTAKVSFGMAGPWRVVVQSRSGNLAVLDFNAGSQMPWQPPQIKAGMAPGMEMNGAGQPGMSGMKTGIADMKTAIIPQLQEIGTYTATGDENWKMQTGFGHNAPMVAMMNQMMVGGSGGEGMKMAPMKMSFGKANYAKPEADGTPTASAPVTITAATASAPNAGDNPLIITVTDAQGKPVTGAKIITTVAMTSMDMGTTHPAVTEKGEGQYASTVTFAMAGLWRVQVKVTPPGQKPQMKAFDFTAK